MQHTPPLQEALKFIVCGSVRAGPAIAPENCNVARFKIADEAAPANKPIL